MDILNPAALKSLIAEGGKWCVSLYMPTHRLGREKQQDPIRLKNLLAEAETKLLAHGLRRPEVQKMMRPAEELLWDKRFWQHQGNGLAIFLTDNFQRVYRLPAAFEEFLLITNSFHIKPLLPLLGRGEKFYVLAVSLNNVRLLEGNADTMTEIELNFPTSMKEVLGTEDPERSLNLYSGSTSTEHARGEGRIYHGHNAGDDEKKDILRFFQAVNQSLNDLLQERTIPMVLAGVDYLLPIYREASSYNNLLEGDIRGNVERENVKDLHAEAWKIVKPIFEESQKKAYEKFEQLKGQGSDLATSDLNETIRAAKFGQVETLFVPLGRQKWGRYDAENNTVIVESDPGPGNEDLFDLAATETLLNSGQVFAVPGDQLPGGGEIATILRYTV
jgi:hypothetical protein